MVCPFLRHFYSWFFFCKTATPCHFSCNGTISYELSSYIGICFYLGMPHCFKITQFDPLWLASTELRRLNFSATCQWLSYLIFDKNESDRYFYHLWADSAQILSYFLPTLIMFTVYKHDLAWTILYTYCINLFQIIYMFTQIYFWYRGFISY